MINPFQVSSALTNNEVAWVTSGLAGILKLAETTAPTLISGVGQVYVKSSDSLLYFKDDSGNEYNLTAGASGANSALSNLASVAINTDLLLGTSDGGALGSATKMWSDLFLASGAVINFNNGNVTLTHSAGVLTLGGTATLALGTNSITMTGSIAATGARVTKGWFTDVESTNMPTVGGTAILTSLTAPQFTTIELGHASDTTLSRVSAGVIAVEGKNVYLAGGTDVAVADGGTGLSTITALSIWVANSANTITEVTPGAGNSIRINAGGTAWEAFTPSASVPATITVANEATDTTCFIAFFTAATGDLGPKSNTGLTYNSNTNSLGATTFVGALTGTASGNLVSGGALGTPSSGTLTNCTGLPIAGLTASTVTALGVGSIELGHASDTTIARSGAGAITVEGVQVILSGAALGTPSSGTLTNCTGLPVAGITASTSTALGVGSIELGHASDTTIARVSAGVASIEGSNIMTVGSADTVTGVKTITSIVLPTNGQIKLTVPTTDGHATGPTCGDFNSGYTSSAVGDLVYLDSSSTWQKCDANTLALYNGLLGIALEVKASGNALLVALPGSFVYATAFPTWTIGSPIYMSETAGAMTQTAPTTTDAASRVMGWGIHADKMYFFPSPDYITHT